VVPLDAVVIGAGIAGLAAAHRLLRAGRRVLAIDAAASPGGKVRTERCGGYLLEVGPQSFFDAPEGPFRRLAIELGLAAEIVAPRPEAAVRWVAQGGRLRRVPADIARILSPAGLRRALREPLVPRGGAGAGDPDETAAAFVARRFGPEVAERLFDALVSGIVAGDPGRLSAADAFGRAVDLERRWGSVVLGLFFERARRRRAGTFRGGMGALPEALARALGPALRLGCEARRIERTGAHWRVAAGGEAIEARAVVLALPAFASARLLEPLDACAAALLSEIPYAALSVVALGYDAGRAFRGRPPAGFGFLAARREGLRTLGCLIPSSAFDGAAPEGKVLLRAFAGGRRDPAAAALDDAALVGLVRREVEPLLGARAAPEFVRIFRHPQAIPQYEVGHARRLAAIEERLRALSGLHLAGNAYCGVALPDVVAGAEKVAARLLADLA
jgi:oxygen-dependent protoporphyrinogen oxidase